MVSNLNSELITAITSAMTYECVNRKELAKKVGVSETYMSLIMNYKKQPSMKLLERIEEALEIEFEVTYKDKNHDTKI